MSCFLPVLGSYKNFRCVGKIIGTVPSLKSLMNLGTIVSFTSMGNSTVWFNGQSLLLQNNTGLIITNNTLSTH